MPDEVFDPERDAAEAEANKPKYIPTEIELQLRSEVEELNVIIGDLSRRLKNANHTITAQKAISVKASRETSVLRRRMSRLSEMYRLETSQSEVRKRKDVQAKEARRYAAEKEKISKAHEDFRYMVLDHEATGSVKKTTSKISKMKEKLVDMETRAESQRLLLQQLGRVDEISEELSLAAQNGDLKNVHRLLSKAGASPNERDEAGFLPIHYACARGHVAVAKVRYFHLVQRFATNLHFSVFSFFSLFRLLLLLSFLFSLSFLLLVFLFPLLAWLGCIFPATILPHLTLHLTLNLVSTRVWIGFFVIPFGLCSH